VYNLYVQNSFLTPPLSRNQCRFVAALCGRVREIKKSVREIRARPRKNQYQNFCRALRMAGQAFQIDLVENM